MNLKDTDGIFYIMNWGCVQDKTQPYYYGVTAEAGNLALDKVAITSDNPYQQWALVPNLTPGSLAGGFTFYNVGWNEELAMVRSNVAGDPVTLKAPKSSLEFCWTLVAEGVDSFFGNELWTIRVADNPSLVLTVSDGKCEGARMITSVHNDSDDKQKWWVSPNLVTG